MQFIGLTSRCRIVGYDRVEEMIRSRQGFIFMLWHGRTMLPVYFYRNMGVHAIIALSRDGELQSRIFRRFGFAVIRGSTGRGGVKAALTAVKRLREGGMLAITPDGPLGPRTRFRMERSLLRRRPGCRSFRSE